METKRFNLVMTSMTMFTPYQILFNYIVSQKVQANKRINPSNLVPKSV